MTERDQDNYFNKTVHEFAVDQSVLLDGMMRRFFAVAVEPGLIEEFFPELPDPYMAHFYLGQCINRRVVEMNEYGHGPLAQKTVDHTRDNILDNLTNN